MRREPLNTFHPTVAKPLALQLAGGAILPGAAPFRRPGHSVSLLEFLRADEACPGTLVSPVNVSPGGAQHAQHAHGTSTVPRSFTVRTIHLPLYIIAELSMKPRFETLPFPYDVSGIKDCGVRRDSPHTRTSRAKRGFRHGRNRVHNGTTGSIAPTGSMALTVYKGVCKDETPRQDVIPCV